MSGPWPRRWRFRVDAENGYAATPDGVAAAVERLAAEGAAGISIEDYEPGLGFYPLDVAVERVAAAAEAAKRHIEAALSYEDRTAAFEETDA